MDNEEESSGKCGRLRVAAKLLSLVLLLYIFICSLDFLSSSFRLIGGKTAGKVISNSELLKNPIVGLMIGVLVTVLVQSSSTSTSIVVTMVASDLIKVRQAIPIIMGANIGTSVTNTFVSLMQASDRNEFRRAFAAATVHDMFNWLTVIVVLPVEVTLHFLEYMTDKLVNLANWKGDKSLKVEFLSKLTKPFTSLIIKVDKDMINRIASGDFNDTDSSSLMYCCKYDSLNCSQPCDGLMNKLGLSDTMSGVVMLLLSILILCTCLVLMVKLLHSMLRGKIATIINKTINAEYRFPFSILVGYIAILIGCILTILVQSSSAFTSALTPLAGMGVISLERIYPLTLGANMGTTTTGILAALAASSQSQRQSLQLAFCHLFFNITGILLFYPIPITRLPIPLARILGNTTAKYRWFSIFYLIMMFFMIPAFVFSLSVAGKWALVGVGGPIIASFFLIILINVIQAKKPNLLPIVLQNWDWLPLWMHSLDPIDNLLVKLVEKVNCLSCCVQAEARHDGHVMKLRQNQSQLNILDPDKRFSPQEGQVMCAYDNVGFVHVNGVDIEKGDGQREITHL